MKNNIFKILIVALSIVAMGFTYADTGNPLVTMVVGMGASVGFQVCSGVYFDSLNLVFATALTGLKRKSQNPQLGGSKRLYIILTEDLLNEFIDYNLIKSAGQFAGAIPLAQGKMAVEIEAWYDSLKWDGEMKIGAGFTQSVEFDVLGYDAEITKLMALLYETPVNVVVQGNDNSLYYIGDKYVPLMFEAKATTPPKGTDRKKVTFTAKNDGYTHPVCPLANTVTFSVAALAA